MGNVEKVSFGTLAFDRGLRLYKDHCLRPHVPLSFVVQTTKHTLKKLKKKG